ncbi:MAG TPA: DUF4893 domain-containing protein [Sphingomicrobium sp.]|nr:DUF4893 domain-containing protein [Sphingomicrobium sp.]
MGLSKPILLLSVLALAGCELAKKEPPRPVVTAPPATKGDVWQGVASSADFNRIRRVATGWSSGLAEARSGGYRDELRAEGKLLDPDAGQPRPMPTPGSYNCRLVRLGKEGGKGPAFQKFKPFFCYVQLEGELFTIVKQTGSQRPAGRLWEDDLPNRLIFLGTLALGGEDEARAYGDDPRRDMAGIFERFAPFKWRLVIPYPQNGARLDVFELTPVADQPEE